MTLGNVIAVCMSETKGVKKRDVGRGLLIKDHGLEGDAHSGNWHRQVSLLASESIMKAKCKGLDVGPGDFAENITTAGIDLASLPVGTILQIGPEAVLEITQIGKECHVRCEIFKATGDCVMPKEGVFARVVKSGTVAAGDDVRIISGEEIADA